VKRGVSLAVLMLALAAAMPARADDEPPWAQGVPAATQAKANELFAEGNALFAQLAHAAALDKYRAASALWDHPMIRFNMAVTLVRLDRMLEAADELDKALRFGATPFTTELYQQALDYQHLIKRQLGNIEVRCDLPGTQILLDGKPWFVAPGSAKVRVAGGEHIVVAERKEYLTVTRRLVVAGGSTASEQLKLVPLESALIVEYPQPKWLPWTVTGVGAAAAFGGLGLWLHAKKRLEDFDRDYTRECPTGCETDQETYKKLVDKQDSALLEGKVGVSMMIAGGAIVVGGVIWGYVNRPTRRLPKVEVAPTAGGAAAAATWSF